MMEDKKWKKKKNYFERRPSPDPLIHPNRDLNY